MINKYKYVEYSEKYKQQFYREKRKLIKILNSNVCIEHIGSTAIPGLGGKGILDVLVGVHKPDLEAFIPQITNHGYIYSFKTSTKDRIFFHKDYRYKKNSRRIHIHLVSFQNQAWEDLLGFRDYLLKNEEKAKEYELLKIQAVELAKGDGAIYRKLKIDFVNNVIKMHKVKLSKN